MRIRLSLTGGVLGLACATVLSLAPAAQAAAPTISGNVTCANGKAVVGVWIQSTGGGSKFASWRKTSATTASYSAQVSTHLPTGISLHVGCGGSAAKWGSDNFSPSIAGVNGSAFISVTNCVNGQCSPVMGYKATQWALAQVGTNKAASNVRVTDNRAHTSWAGLCLAFVASGYLNAGDASPTPVVYNQTYGPGATALSMYRTYNADHLIQKTWANSSGTQSFPPLGALVFYPTLTSEGHIAISVGGGNVVSANEVGSPLVRPQKYNSFAGYAGWAFPINAGG
jgi:hypothetical protein